MNSLSRIAIVQEDSILEDKTRNLQKAFRLVRSAGEQGAKLILFPEMYLTGYSVEENIQRLAEEVPGPSVNRLAKLAERNDICICMGLPEKSPASQQLFNSLVCLSNRGEIIAVYRKLHLFDEEKKLFTPGDELQIIDTAIGRIGLLICYDFEFPELARAITLRGADVLLVSSANMQPWCDHQQVYVRARAMENQVFLALANRVGSEKGFNFCGNSVLVNPMGKILAHANMQDPALLIGEIDIDTIRKVRDSGVSYIKDRRLGIY
jgi:5-aminopentanamidase